LRAGRTFGVLDKIRFPGKMLGGFGEQLRRGRGELHLPSRDGKDPSGKERTSSQLGSGYVPRNKVTQASKLARGKDLGIEEKGMHDCQRSPSRNARGGETGRKKDEIISGIRKDCRGKQGSHRGAIKATASISDTFPNRTTPSRHHAAVGENIVGGGVRLLRERIPPCQEDKTSA